MQIDRWWFFIWIYHCCCYLFYCWLGVIVFTNKVTGKTRDQATLEDHYLFVGVFQLSLYALEKWAEFQISGLQSQEVEIPVRDASGEWKNRGKIFVRSGEVSVCMRNRLWVGVWQRCWKTYFPIAFRIIWTSVLSWHDYFWQDYTFPNSVTCPLVMLKCLRRHTKKSFNMLEAARRRKSLEWKCWDLWT